MSVIEMASTTKFSYQRLRNYGNFEGEGGEEEEEERLIGRSRRSSWLRIKRLDSKKRRRIRIPGLRKFLRRKVKAVRVSWKKVWKRLKESRSHMGDMFAGNYLFIQVSPTPLKCVDKSFIMGHGLHGHAYSFPSRYNPGRIA